MTAVLAAEAPKPTPEATPAAQSAQPPRIETKEDVKAEIARVFGKHARTALCIALNESGYQEKVTGPKKWINGVLQIGNRDGSLDRGIFQINNRWHPEVADVEAYTAKTNIAHAYRISKGGTDWHQWASRGKCGV